jgi:hypothetical protein
MTQFRQFAALAVAWTVAELPITSDAGGAGWVWMAPIPARGPITISPQIARTSRILPQKLPMNCDNASARYWD